MAAAAGGITTILDMPNTIPPTTNLQRLDEKRRLAKKSIVNYGFHFGSTKDNIAEIQKVKDVASVKVYMEYTTGDLRIDDVKILKKIFRTCSTPVPWLLRFRFSVFLLCIVISLFGRIHWQAVCH